MSYKHSFIQSAINWFKENRMVAKVNKICKDKTKGCGIVITYKGTR